MDPGKDPGRNEQEEPDRRCMHVTGQEEGGYQRMRIEKSAGTQWGNMLPAVASGCHSRRKGKPMSHFLARVPQPLVQASGGCVTVCFCLDPKIMPAPPPQQGRALSRESEYLKTLSGKNKRKEAASMPTIYLVRSSCRPCGGWLISIRDTWNLTY